MSGHVLAIKVAVLDSLTGLLAKETDYFYGRDTA